jgi:hypothetical protein
LDGRPVVIDADESGLLVIVATWRGAWAMRSCIDQLLPALGMLRRTRVPLRLQLAGSVTLNLLPTPGFVMRCVLPELNGLC